MRRRQARVEGGVRQIRRWMEECKKVGHLLLDMRLILAPFSFNKINEPLADKMLLSSFKFLSSLTKILQCDGIMFLISRTKRRRKFFTKGKSIYTPFLSILLINVNAFNCLPFLRLVQIYLHQISPHARVFITGLGGLGDSRVFMALIELSGLGKGFSGI